jgi:hypothetical protein
MSGDSPYSAGVRFLTELLVHIHQHLPHISFIKPETKWVDEYEGAVEDVWVIY